MLVLVALALIRNQIEATPEPSADVSPRETTTPVPVHPQKTEPKAVTVSDRARVYSSPEFRSFAGEVLRDLPTRADLQRLSPEEVHHTPKPVTDAGVKLGEIAEILAKQPELEGDAFGFYESCATGSDYPQSVRALCFFHWERLGKKLGRTIQPEKVPESVRRIAQQL